MKHIRFILFLLLFAFVSALNIKSANTNPIMRLTHARDSLLVRLHSKITPKERLAVLTNLGDVGLNLNNDYSYVEKLWTEALKQHDANSILTAGRSLTLRWINMGDMRKAEEWIKICNKEFIGSYRYAALSYLLLMRDIRLYQNQNEMAAALAYRQLNINRSTDSYDKMSTLYKLGTLAFSSLYGNKTIKMRPWSDYMEEGYKIAKSLPFRESYSFRNQFLLALCFVSVDYSRQYMDLIKKYREQPDIKQRIYFTNRSDIMGAARMVGWANAMSRKEVDYWFARFCSLTSEYPYDCPTPYNFYFYSEAVNYYMYTKNNEKVLQCCDSVIANASKYKMDDLWYIETRGNILASMGRWQEAYENSKKLVAGKDSVSKASTASKLMELQTQYDVDRLTFAKKTSELRLIFAVVVCLILSILLWFLFRHSRTLRHKNEALFETLRQLQQTEDVADLVRAKIPDADLSAQEQVYRSLCHIMHTEGLYKDPYLKRDDLASRLGTNRTYLTETVKSCAGGLSFTDFVNRYRLRYASSLLTDQLEMPVNEVGDVSGFNTRSTFNRQFRDYFGMTPSEYRSIAKEKRVES